MAIRLSGLTSGMDTDAIVQELVSAYSKKTEKYEKASTKLTWKQDAWKTLNTKIYDLYTKTSNMRFSSAYNLRKTSVSDATKATVTASSDAVTGTQKLKIISTAQSSYMTGAYIGENITGDTTLEDLGYEGNYTNIKYKSVDGEVKEIGVRKDTKISEVITKLKDVGLNANLDANNGRIYVNAKTSGEKSDFTLYADSVDALDALDALGLNTAMIKKENGQNVFTEAAGSFAAYYDYYVEALAGKGITEPTKPEEPKKQENESEEDFTTRYNTYKEAYAQYEADYAQFEKDRDAALLTYMRGVYDDYTTAYRRNDELKVLYRELKNDNGAWQTQVDQLEEQKAARTSLDTIKEVLTEKGLSSKYTETEVVDIIKELRGVAIYETDKDGKKTGISQDALGIMKDFTNSDADSEALLKIFDNMSDDVANVSDYVRWDDRPDISDINLTEVDKQIKEKTDIIEANEVILEGYQKEMDANDVILTANAEMIDLDVTNDDDTIDETKLALALEAFVDKANKAAEIFKDENGKYSNAQDNAVKIKGSNAKIELNGVEYTSETSSFAINGLTINALATTDNDSEISITTSVDTQGIYDKVKEFLTEYNNVINEMSKLYNADSARDYEPLTDEEKEAMSDEQIEKWEGKIKDSLLRRDTTLNSIMSVMVNAMAQTFDIGGQKLSLSTFGIQTLGFLNAPKNEHYAYHIDGDEDDENTSGKKDKLMAAIEANPDQIEEFMKKLCENLYTAVDNKMKSTELSSAYKVYNDKEMDKELKKYAEAISKWEDKVKDKEDYYYKQFSNMEVALSKLQNQTSSLTGLLGS